MDKGRLEAFSDGVLAVAITLLVLDLHATVSDSATLAQQLREEWVTFAAFVLSFFTIGVIWVNHHALFALAARVDRTVMFYNLLLLMWVTTIPFTTSTMAEFLREGAAQSRVAVVLYGVSMEGMALSFALILRHLIRSGLTVRPVSADAGRRAVRRFGLGALIYPVIMLVGLLSPIAMLVLYSLLTIYYITEQTPILQDDGKLEDAS